MPTPDPVILSWDWRQQPDLNDLAAALLDVSGGTVHLHQVNTRSDEYAIVIAAEKLTDEDVAERYRRRWEGEDY